MTITLGRGRSKTIDASVYQGGDGRILNSIYSFTLGQIHMALAKEQDLGTSNRFSMWNWSKEHFIVTK